jgi:hypothetical protein
MTIDAYVSATVRSFAAAGERAIAELAEAPAVDGPRARWLFDRYLETLDGFALGIAAASLAHAARVWLGADADRTVIDALGSRARRPRARTADPFAFAEAQPSRAVLSARVHAGAHHMGADLRALAAPVAEAKVMLAHLCSDSLAAERFARELARGWSALLDALAGHAREPESPLWREWARRVRGEARPAVVREHIAIIA